MTQAPDIARVLSAYVPMDRRHSASAGGTAPAGSEGFLERTQGAALFADMSGFTPLTEALARAHGPRRGAEEMLHHLNAVYDALIDQVHGYRGSVVGFAGDAVTCWFEDQASGIGQQAAAPLPVASCPLPDASSRATACALAMQGAMRAFAAVPVPGSDPVPLALKVAVASGPARRFLVGDPRVQIIDVLAGATVTRVAVAEQLAEPGEVVVDPATWARLGDGARAAAFRDPPESAGPERDPYAVVVGLRGEVPRTPWPPLTGAPSAERLRPWVLPAVYERVQAGLGEFLTDLRPAVALFVRFGGIDYEREGAAAKLDAFVRWVQGIVSRHDGTLLQLTLGDKGSYLYAAFGAPVAHEDDARRAALAALDLQAEGARPAFITPLQIGLGQGSVRAGACGSRESRTYGCMGDEVNLAARLMQHAAPGEILASERVHRTLADTFPFTAHPPLRLKGKADLLSIFTLAGAAPRRTMHLLEPRYVLPMVGREAELRLVEERLGLARQGRGQIVGISGEAGVGKSRLVAEIIRLAREAALAGYGGACQADGVNTLYLVWRSIWCALLDVDADAPARGLREKLEALAPDRIDALPLLGAVLGVALPDSDFTRVLEPQYRKSALEALLVDCLRAAAGARPLLLVLEDLHWIDPASHDLLQSIARAIDDVPVLIVLAYRPPEALGTAGRPPAPAPRLTALPHFTTVHLRELGPAEAERVLRGKLRQLFPDGADAVPAALIEQVAARAQGNPFYLEELLNYLHDRGFDPRSFANAGHGDAAALEALGLPDSLHSLILARIDQLGARQQLTLKVASIIGRVFRFNHLCSYCPDLGPVAAIKEDLAVLARLDLTPVDTPEPDLAYVFRHIVTREVAYDCLPYAARAVLHEQYARYLEAQPAAEPELDLLAYHYGLSENAPKQREYLRRAGLAAAVRFVNVQAIDYLTRALALIPEASREPADLAERYELLLARERALDMLGQREAQARDLDALQALAAATGDAGRQATATLRRGSYAFAVSDYPAALAAAEVALALARAEADAAHAAAAHLLWGRALVDVGDYPGGGEHFRQALAMFRAAGDRLGEAQALNVLGQAAWRQGDPAGARARLEAALAVEREMGDRASEARALNLLGIIYQSMSDGTAAARAYEQSLALCREIGYHKLESDPLCNLGTLYAEMGEHAEAQRCYQRALAIDRETGNREDQIIELLNIAELACRQADFGLAEDCVADAERLAADIGSPVRRAHVLSLMGQLNGQLGDYAQGRACLTEALDILRRAGDREDEATMVARLGLLCHQAGDDAAAEDHARQASGIARETRDDKAEAYALTVLGHSLAGRGRAGEAVEAYRRALELRLAAGQTGMAVEPEAGLARLALAAGDMAQACSHVDVIMAALEVRVPGGDGCGALNGPEEVLRVYLTCFRVLRAAGDPRAPGLLETAHGLLLSRAGRIDGEARRRLFLENVRAHRELEAEWRSRQNPARPVSG